MDKDNYILANMDFSGFYRVNYDIENWNMIIQQLKNNPQVRISLKRNLSVLKT